MEQDDLLQPLLEQWAKVLADARQRRSGPSPPGAQWSKRAFTNRHVRRESDAYLRSLNLRIALNPRDAEAAASKQRLEDFQDGLEPSPSRWIIVAVLVLVALLAQLVIDVAVHTGFAGLNSDLFSKSTSGDPASIIPLISKLFTGAPLDRLVILAAPSIAAYLVLRGPVYGFDKAQRLVSESKANEVEALGSMRSAEFPFDLAVKALLAIAALSYGAIAVVYQTSLGFYDIGPEMYVNAAIGLAGFVRLSWIGIQWRKRESGFPLFLFAFAVVVIVFASAEIASWLNHYALGAAIDRRGTGY